MKPKFTEGDSDVPLDDTVPATFEDGSTTKVIPGVESFTVAPDSFVYEPNPYWCCSSCNNTNVLTRRETAVKANYVK